MALSAMDWLSVGGVLALMAAVMVYNQLQAGKVLRARRQAELGPTGSPKPWVGRYLQYEGDVVGQVVAMEEGRVIVRKGAATLVVPRSQVREQGADLGLVGTVDLIEAAREGAAWKA